MDAKIPATDWSDPDLDTATSEVLLTLAWIRTNPDRNDCGAYRFSATRFSFETKGLSPSWHEKTVALVPDRFARDGHWFVYLPFIQRHLQLTVFGKDGGLNHICKALIKPFQALSKPLQSALRAAYPELAASVWNGIGAGHTLEALAHPLPSPSRSVNPHSSPPLDPAGTAAGGKGLPSPRAEQSSTEQNSASGESEGGGGAVVPAEADVLEYARTFQDMARGYAGIPEHYAISWMAWRSSHGGPFPRNWKNDLRWRFIGAVGRGEVAPINLAAAGTSADKSRRLDSLRRTLEKGGLPPEKRAELRAEIAALEK